MPASQDPAEAATELLTFRLADRQFGVAMSSVREIVRISRVTRVPLSPAYVLGVMNLRGSVITVLSGSARFGRPPSPLTDRTRVLVLTIGDAALGLAVDEVERILQAAGNQVEPVPRDAGDVPRELLAGVVKEGGRTILRIAPDSLLDRDTAVAAFGAVAAGARSAEQTAVAPQRTRRVVVAEIGREEFGIGIEVVSEALRFAEPNPIPDAPPFLAGLVTVRDSVLPVIELRALMRRPSLREETARKTAQIRAEYDKARSLMTAPPACAPILRNAQRLLDALGVRSASASQARAANSDLLQRLQSGRAPEAPAQIEALSARLTEIEHDASDDSDRRVLVIDSENARFGLAVDRVTQVLDVPESAIQPPPPIAQQGGVHLNGLARLENPPRLVLLLDLAEMIARNRLTTVPSAAAASGAATDMTTPAANQNARAQWVTFTTGDEIFGLPVADVVEIGRMETVTRVPGAPKFIQGVINLRGEVVPAIDLRKRFALQAASSTAQSRIVYIRSGEVKIGLIVDRVLEILALPDLEPPPAAVCSKRVAEYLAGVAKRGDRVLLLLSAEKLLTRTEQEGVEQTVHEGGSPRPRARKRS